MVGKYAVTLFDDIVSGGVIKYRYIMGVYDESKQPCYFVTSEVNAMVEEFGGSSHFLCIFDMEGHAIYNDSDDWADEKKFTKEALKIITEKFVIQQA